MLPQIKENDVLDCHRVGIFYTRKRPDMASTGAVTKLQVIAEA